MIQPSPERATMMEQVVDVETPEQVVFSYSIAGIGTRAAAVVVDMAIIMAATLVLFVLALALLIAMGTDRRAGVEMITEGWAMALLVVLQFVIMWGYHVGFEGLRDGQTPGKRLLRIRVVRDGGYSVTVGEAAIRNVLRVVDMLPPMTYLVGIIAVLQSRSGKRLGDVVAGTMVVRERVMREQIDQLAPAATEAVSVTAALSEPEFALLERFLARLPSLSGDARSALVHQLTTRFEAQLPADALPGEPALAMLYAQERQARAAGMAARGDVGAARERHAILREGAPRWRQFATSLQRAQTAGLARMSEEQVSQFVAEYRDVATDLARLRTASGSADTDAVFHVSRLVAAGHNLLYRQ
jgi:uncharacterized RDD family membrane protein YckC